MHLLPSDDREQMSWISNVYSHQAVWPVGLSVHSGHWQRIEDGGENEERGGGEPGRETGGGGGVGGRKM